MAFGAGGGLRPEPSRLPVPEPSEVGDLEPVPDRGTTSKHRYRSPLAPARLLRILAVATAAASAILVAYLRSASGVVAEIERDPLAVYQDDLVDISRNVQRVEIALIVVQLMMTILLIVWIRRIYRNLTTLGASSTRFKPGWAVGAWFVPFLNFVRPKQIVDETWRKSDPELPAVMGMATSQWVPKIIHFWWGFWILATITAGVVRGLPYPTSLSGVSRLLWLELGGAAAITISALCLERVVARLTMRHQARAVAVGVDQALAQPWAVSARTGGTLDWARVAVIALPWVIAGAALGLGSWTLHASLDGGTGLTSSGAESVAIDAVAIGDCFDLPPGTAVVLVALIPCEEPHDAELFSILSLGTADEPYPGEDAVFDQIGDECIPAFDEFIGIAYEESEFDFGFVYPLAESWAAGNRTVQCFVWTVDGSKLVGSMQGSAR